MTQATSKRPKELLEEIEEKKKEPEKIILKKSKHDLFQGIMEEWFKSLNRKEKTSITPKVLKRKAVSVCHRHSIVYDRLPRDWVKKLKKIGMKLKTQKRKKAPNTKTEQKKSIAGSDVSTEVINEGKSDADEETPNVLAPEGPKKLVDLSNQPPPPVWVDNYARGIVLPRMLTIYSTHDSNIVFYDYNPRLTDETGKEIKMPIRKRQSGLGILPGDQDF